MKISILGCGWLGSIVAEILVRRGHEVAGSGTQDSSLLSLKDQGVLPYKICVHPNRLEGDFSSFFKADSVLISLPFSRTMRGLYYQEQVRLVAERLAASGCNKVVFLSSTSVYSLTNGDVNEEIVITNPDERSRALIEAERLILDLKHQCVVVLRLAGLHGRDRNSKRYLLAHPVMDHPDNPVNLVHVEDAAQVTALCLTQVSVESGIYNCVADAHPTRQQFYNKRAECLGLPLPQFSSSKSGYKQVSNQKLKDQLAYEFQYPDPLFF